MNIQTYYYRLRPLINCLEYSCQLKSLRNYSEKNIANSSPAKTTQKLFEGLLKGDRASLARSITLIESTHPVKCSEARKLINLANAHAKKINLESKTFR